MRSRLGAAGLLIAGAVVAASAGMAVRHRDELTVAYHMDQLERSDRWLDAAGVLARHGFLATTALERCFLRARPGSRTRARVIYALGLSTDPTALRTLLRLVQDAETTEVPSITDSIDKHVRLICGRDPEEWCRAELVIRNALEGTRAPASVVEPYFLSVKAGDSASFRVLDRQNVDSLFIEKLSGVLDGRSGEVVAVQPGHAGAAFARFRPNSMNGFAEEGLFLLAISYQTRREWIRIGTAWLLIKPPRRRQSRRSE